MRSRGYIIGIAVLLFASCGQQYHAEKTIKAFVEANAKNPELMTKRDFADLGTTRHINDSLIAEMRQRGAELYKQDISYPEGHFGDLFYLRMSYVHGTDTLQNTFYLNQELTEVVAFK